MNTREIAVEYRLAHWAQVMRDRRESGLSIKAFCKEAGFHENVYYYWQRKLREAACGQMAESQAQASQAGLVTSGFTEVCLSETPVQSVKDEAIGTGRLHVDVAGVQISADSSYPPEKLAELLRELLR